MTEGALAGATIEAVEPYGKHLLIRTDDGRTLDVHLGMHGRVRLRPSGAGSGRHVLRTPAGDAVIHHPSRYDVRRSRTHRLRLGPDVLGDFDPEEYLRRARLVDRPIGEVLLDQRVLAGVGNVAKSEALWRCRVDPFAPVSALGDDRLLALADRGGRRAAARRRRRRAAATRGLQARRASLPALRRADPPRRAGRGPAQHLLVPGLRRVA